jgi:hypothetical protein
MSDEQYNESQAIVRELERLRKGVRRFNVVLITVVSFALAAPVLLLLFVLAR